MVGVTNPCFQCSDRTMGCHGKCSKYSDYRSQIDAEKTKIQKKRNDDQLWDVYRLETIAKARRAQKG